MSIFFTTEDRAVCKYCRHQLPRYSMSGHCPHCRHWYAVERATVAPGRLRAIALVRKSRPISLGRVSGVWSPIAAVGFVLGNAAILIIVGRMALRSLWHACGMTW